MKVARDETREPLTFPKQGNQGFSILFLLIPLHPESNKKRYRQTDVIL